MSFKYFIDIFTFWIVKRCVSRMIFNKDHNELETIQYIEELECEYVFKNDFLKDLVLEHLRNHEVNIISKCMEYEKYELVIYLLKQNPPFPLPDVIDGRNIENKWDVYRVMISLDLNLEIGILCSIDDGASFVKTCYNLNSMYPNGDVPPYVLWYICSHQTAFSYGKYVRSFAKSRRICAQWCRFLGVEIIQNFTDKMYDNWDILNYAICISDPFTKFKVEVILKNSIKLGNMQNMMVSYEVLLNEKIKDVLRASFSIFKPTIETLLLIRETKETNLTYLPTDIIKHIFYLATGIEYCRKKEKFIMSPHSNLFIVENGYISKKEYERKRQIYSNYYKCNYAFEVEYTHTFVYSDFEGYINKFVDRD